MNKKFFSPHFFIPTKKGMSSTTTSESSASSEESYSEEKDEITQHQDEHQVLKIRLAPSNESKKRKREDEESDEEGKEALSSGSSQKEGESGPPKKKRAKVNRMPQPKTEGFWLNIKGGHPVPITADIIKGISDNFASDAMQKLHPGITCDFYDSNGVKRLPSLKEKEEWQKELKERAKQRAKDEGKVKKELTPAEKEARRLRNQEPAVKARKKELAKLKRDIFREREENIKDYKKRVQEKYGPPPKRTRKKPVIEEKKVDTDVSFEQA